MFISPAETNADVKVMDNYEFDKPKGVTGTPANGQNALWDPKFRGAVGDTLIGGQTETTVSNNSYAHNPPFLKRKAYWQNNFTATEAVLGNRGPDFVLTTPGTATTEAVWNLVAGATGTLSNTLPMHGSRNKWEGMVGYNDNHVNYELRADVETLLFTFTNLPQGGRSQKDNVFENEDDQNQTEENYAFSTTTNNNSNALLRPYRDGFTATAGANTTVTIIPWID
jgi:hypothetical protein